MNQQILKTNLEIDTNVAAVPICLMLNQLRQAGAMNSAHFLALLSENPDFAFELWNSAQLTNAIRVWEKEASVVLTELEPQLLHDLLVKALARQTIITTVDDEIAAINSWYLRQQYFLLATLLAKALNYSNPEMAGFAMLFCLLDSKQAQHLEVPLLWNDLQFTIHEPLNAQIDTALLSRLVWCCRHAVRNHLNIDAGLSNSFLQLLGVSETAMQRVFSEVDLQLKERSRVTGIAEALEHLQQEERAAEAWLQSVKLRSQQQIQKACYLQSLQVSTPTTLARLKYQLKRTLCHHQLPTNYLLLGAESSSTILRPLLSQGYGLTERDFAIPLMLGRNAIATCIHMGNIQVFKPEDSELAPVDRQLFRVMDCESLLFLPLEGLVSGVLVLPDVKVAIDELSCLQQQVNMLLKNYYTFLRDVNSQS